MYQYLWKNKVGETGTLIKQVECWLQRVYLSSPLSVKQTRLHYYSTWSVDLPLQYGARRWRLPGITQKESQLNPITHRCVLASASSFVASTSKHHEVKDHEMQDMSIGCLQLFLALLYNTASDGSRPVPEFEGAVDKHLVELSQASQLYVQYFAICHSFSCSAENILKTFKVCLCGYPACELPVCAISLLVVFSSREPFTQTTSSVLARRWKIHCTCRYLHQDNN